MMGGKCMESQGVGLLARDCNLSLSRAHAQGTLPSQGVGHLARDCNYSLRHVHPVQFLLVARGGASRQRLQLSTMGHSIGCHVCRKGWGISPEIATLRARRERLSRKRSQGVGHLARDCNSQGRTFIRATRLRRKGWGFSPEIATMRVAPNSMRAVLSQGVGLLARDCNFARPAREALQKAVARGGASRQRLQQRSMRER